MERSKTKQLALNAVLAAMCAVLGYVALDMGSIKITFESLPILIGAYLFGPLNGFAVGTIGTLIYQMLRYGFTATTVLWILPYSLCGIVIGMYAMKKDFKLSQKQYIIATVLVELMITAINTFSLYVDSHIYGYYYPALIVGMLVPRILVCIGKSIVFALIMPKIVSTLRSVVR